MQKRERSFRLEADSASHAALTHELQVTALLGWRGPRDRESAKASSFAQSQG